VSPRTTHHFSRPVAEVVVRRAAALAAFLAWVVGAPGACSQALVATAAPPSEEAPGASRLAAAAGAAPQHHSPLLAAAGRTTDAARRRQLRHLAAVRELIAALHPAERPRRILYLGSGSHLAPLAACELLPLGASCELTLRERDPGVAAPLIALLQGLADDGTISRLATMTDAGGQRWSFALDGVAVHLRLDVDPTTAPGEIGTLLRAGDLRTYELVVVHDWSGDPFENLRLLHQVLDLAAAEEAAAPLPLVMVEDLRRHSYGVDIAFFGVRAATALPYGHRETTPAGPEEGPPSFGGAVVLDLAPSWWRAANARQRSDLLDLLLVSQHDLRRRNVLAAGEPPRVAPVVLDWWSGFSSRSVRDADLRNEPDWRQRLLASTSRLTPLLTTQLAVRLACHHAAWAAALELLARGDELPDDGTVVDEASRPRWEADYRQALHAAPALRAERNADRPAQARAAATAQTLGASCPADEGEEAAARLLALRRFLAGDP
jgi:hypothetical protein